MALVPAICDNCGTAWAATNIIGGSPGVRGQVQMTGNRVGPCPKCGARGRIPDGVYDLIGDTLEVVTSADLPHDTLQSLIEILRDAADGKVQAKAVVEQVAANAPALAPTINVFLERPAKDRRGFLILLVTILMAVMAGPGTVNDVIQLLDREKPGLSPPARTTPAPSSGPSSRATTSRPAPRRRRPAKTHGKSKPRKKRH